MASISQMLPTLKMTPQAIQKRSYRAAQREKRRRAFFVHDYFRIKYPQVFTEANRMYQQFMNKYPDKPDFTKTYYFRKWATKMDKVNNAIMVPHLPILVSSERLQAVTNQQTPDVQQQTPEVLHQPPTIGQVAEVQTSEPTETITAMSLDEMGLAVDEIMGDVQQQTPDVQQQTPDVQQQTPTVQQETPGVQQQTPEVLHQPPTIGQVVEVQTSEPTETITGMSLDEMGLAVDEIMKVLQSDRDLMDIVENLDLPESLWQNELAIPDYVLETDYDW